MKNPKKQKNKKDKSHFESGKKTKEIYHKKDNSTSNLPRISANRMIYGMHSCLSAIENPKRTIKSVFMTDSLQDKIIGKLKENDRNNLNIKIMQRPDLDKLANYGVHNGIVIEVEPLPDLNIEDILNQNRKPYTSILVLDQAVDPHNIGACIRSMSAFHFDALIVTDNNAPSFTPAMVKASSGAIENIPVLRVTNIKSTLDYLKSKNFWITGLDGHTDKTDLTQSLSAHHQVVVMGAEGKGMRRLTRESCDFIVKIDMHPQMESLNLSNAAAITMHQRYTFLKNTFE